MSFLTAFGLSGRNLLTKKGRTLITSIAGSIGIIGVCLVLALSSGFGGYITRTEEDMLSAYPIQVTETTMDYETIMNNMMNGMMKPDLDRMDDKVYVNSFLTKLSEGMTVKNNITREYLDYIAAMDPLAVRRDPVRVRHVAQRELIYRSGDQSRRADARCFGR